MTARVISAALVGEVENGRLILPGGARSGDRLLLTKGVPVEAVSLLAREFPDRLRRISTETELDEARDYLFQPGISVVKDARLAARAGRVTAMHDPTEGRIGFGAVGAGRGQPGQAGGRPARGEGAGAGAAYLRLSRHRSAGLDRFRRAAAGGGSRRM